MTDRCRFVFFVHAGVLCLVLAGCGDSARGPYDPKATADHRNIQRGEELFQDALKVIDRDPATAETLLNECLTADLFHGAAHNDLGVLLLKQGKLYEAANEFAWAGKLLPGQPDPRVNLAIALDRGGKPTDAIAACHTALEIQPGYLPAIQTAVLIQIREGLSDETTKGHLDTIVERTSDERWREWAIAQRTKAEASKP